MSPRGRSAALPPADHAAAPVVDPLNGLVVHHRNRDGHVKNFDFSTLPVAEPMQRSLATAFAAAVKGRSSHETPARRFRELKQFVEFASQCERPPHDLDELTATLVKAWWFQLKDSPGGRATFQSVTALLRKDPRVHTGAVAEELARRVPTLPRQRMSYAATELDQIRLEARRTFRSALLRIEENAAYLERWRAGAIAPGDRDWRHGEGLDILARTGDLPRYVDGSLLSRYERAMGGRTATKTWKRLFLDRLEATSLGVLLMAEFGWNLAVINAMPTPTTAPDPGRDGRPTYTISIKKYRGDRFETENVTDTGADSPGRLITKALQATRFARAVAHDLDPGTDRFLAWRARPLGRPAKNTERRLVVGPIVLGLDRDAPTGWGKVTGTGSPFRRGRRTVVVTRGEPSQHTQETHERRYVLPDQRVQEEAAPIIAAGAAAALAHARKTVGLAARLSEVRDPDHRETVTADCSGTEGSPAPLPDGGCGASFVLCLACENALVHVDHHPRLVLLHQALAQARSVLHPARWDQNWSETHARLEHLRRKIGDGGWNHAHARITETDREIVDDLLSGDLNP